MDGRTDSGTDGRPENIYPPPAPTGGEGLKTSLSTDDYVRETKFVTSCGYISTNWHQLDPRITDHFYYKPFTLYAHWLTNLLYAHPNFGWHSCLLHLINLHTTDDHSPFSTHCQVPCHFPNSLLCATLFNTSLWDYCSAPADPAFAKGGRGYEPSITGVRGRSLQRVQGQRSGEAPLKLKAFLSIFIRAVERLIFLIALIARLIILIAR